VLDAIGDDLADLAELASQARGGAGVHRRRLETALRVLQALPADGISLSAVANDK
jgi:hypothetical protein